MAKSERAPYLQFYVGDYLNDIRVVSMSMEERGIYTTLLFSAWLWAENDIPPRLPNDITLLAGICKLKKSKIRYFFGLFPNLFLPTSDNKFLENKRLSETFYEMKEQAQKRTDASKKANSIRWGKQNKKNPNGLRNGLTTDSKQTPSHSHSIIKQDVDEEEGKNPESENLSLVAQDVLPLEEQEGKYTVEQFMVLWNKFARENKLETISSINEYRKTHFEARQKAFAHIGISPYTEGFWVEILHNAKYYNHGEYMGNNNWSRTKNGRQPYKLKFNRLIRDDEIIEKFINVVFEEDEVEREVL